MKVQNRTIARFKRCLSRGLLIEGAFAAMLLRSRFAIASTLTVVGMGNAATISNPTAADRAVPRYDHIINIIEENHAYGQIIGNPNAPNINKIARVGGTATQFYAEVHPSEANYIALIGGSTFGIHDDDAYYCVRGDSRRYCGNSKASDYVNHTVNDVNQTNSLLNQLQANKLTWKAYFESIPSFGTAQGFPDTPTGPRTIFYPENNQSPTQPDQLYGAKHNGFINFQSVQKLNDAQLSQQFVGFDRLAKDLASGNLPNYSHIVANQCNEMHGLNNTDPKVQAIPDCAFESDSARIKRGDAVVGQLVQQITSASIWKKGNNAIIITWDEDNNPPVKTGTTQGCCGFDRKSNANFGGGQIATVVLTNHGKGGVVDNTPYNHYSLLRTTEDAFGIHDYLNKAGDTADGVQPMTALFAVNSTIVNNPSGFDSKIFWALGILGLGTFGASFWLWRKLKNK